MVKNIIFDFDGVILDSLSVKEHGFRLIFAAYPQEKVAQLLQFHRDHGGVSRFVKIQYFFENILNQEIDLEGINHYAQKFSNILIAELTKEKYLIQDTLEFIKSEWQKLNLHVASGTEENELKYLCAAHGLTHYFKSIHGSPEIKEYLVRNIIKNNCYSEENTVFVGDSMTDYQAAKASGIAFYGINNNSLQPIADRYIFSFKTDDVC